MNKIGVIGLGKVGSSLLVSIASKGFNVIGLDINRQIIEDINHGIAPFPEKNLQEYLDKYKDKIFCTSDFDFRKEDVELIFVVVPTPSISDNSFSLKYVIKVFKELAYQLRNDNKYKVFVLSSTVMPNSMNKIKRIIEEISGKKCTTDFGLCYNPMLIEIGNVIDGFVNPDLIIIGESDKKSGDILSKFWIEMISKNKSVSYKSFSKIKRMRFIDAEITKMAINSFLTMRISYINTLSEICEKIPEGNIDIIVDAIFSDYRLGSKIIGGLGYGGTCFPRDNKAFTKFAKSINAQSILPINSDKVNDRQIRRVIDKVREEYVDGNIGILGLTYKPNVYVIEDSQAIEIATELSIDYPVIVYDPSDIAMSQTTEVLGDKVLYASSINELLANCDMVIITVPWKYFYNIKVEDFRKNIVLIDCWRILNKPDIKKKVRYIGLGLG